MDYLGFPDVDGQSWALEDVIKDVHAYMELLRRVSKDGTIIGILEVDDGCFQHFRLDFESIQVE